MDICDPRLDHNQLDDIPRKEGSNSCNIYVTLMKSTDPHLAGNHYISMGFFLDRYSKLRCSPWHHEFSETAADLLLVGIRVQIEHLAAWTLRACSNGPTMMSCADKTHQNIGEMEVLLGRKIGFWLLIMGIEWWFTDTPWDNLSNYMNHGKMQFKLKIWGLNGTCIGYIIMCITNMARYLLQCGALLR